MDDSLRVGRRQRAPDLDRVGDGLDHRHRPSLVAQLADAVLQRLALDVLEDDVGMALVLPGVDHRDDVGM